MNIEMVSSHPAKALPGIEMLRTDAAREIADRQQFRGSIGHHVYVNGFELARVEAAGLKDPEVIAKLNAHGWRSPSDVQWFREGDTTFTPHRLAEAVVAVIEELEERSVPDTLTAKR